MIAREVTFIGGPLDGHVHYLSQAPEQLPSLATIEVSPDFVRVITGCQRRIGQRPTSTAVYCLDHDVEPPRYCFLASIGVQQSTAALDEPVEQAADLP
jgi:hypothetical protein